MVKHFPKQIGHIHWEKVRVVRKIPPSYNKFGEVILDIPYELYEFVDPDIVTARLRNAIRQQFSTKGIQIDEGCDSITFPLTASYAGEGKLRWLMYTIYHINCPQMTAINQWIADTWNWRFARMSPKTQRTEMAKWDQSVVKENYKGLFPNHK